MHLKYSNRLAFHLSLTMKLSADSVGTSMCRRRWFLGSISAFGFLLLIVMWLIEEINDIPSLYLFQLLIRVTCLVTTFEICGSDILTCIALTLFRPFNKCKLFFAGILEYEWWKKMCSISPASHSRTFPLHQNSHRYNDTVMYSPFYGKGENCYSTSYQQGVKKDVILPYSLSLSYKEIHPSSLKWFHPIGRGKGAGEKTYWISPFVISNS